MRFGTGPSRASFSARFCYEMLVFSSTFYATAVGVADVAGDDHYVDAVVSYSASLKKEIFMFNMCPLNLVY